MKDTSTSTPIPTTALAHTAALGQVAMNLGALLPEAKTAVADLETRIATKNQAHRTKYGSLLPRLDRLHKALALFVDEIEKGAPSIAPSALSDIIAAVYYGDLRLSKEERKGLEVISELAFHAAKEDYTRSEMRTQIERVKQIPNYTPSIGRDFI